MNKKIKLHHVLIGVILVLFISAVLLGLKRKNDHMNKIFRSQLESAEIEKRIKESALQFIEGNSIKELLGMNPEDLGPIYIAVFKLEGKMELWFPKIKKFFGYDFKYVSDGFGLRVKKEDTSFPEGLYEIKALGFHKKTGPFIQLDYPSEQVLKDQKIKIENFEFDATLITHEPAFASYILLEEDLLETLVYLLLKWGHEGAKIVVFPQRPPLQMSLDGTMVLAEIYSDLSKIYDQMTGELYGSQ